MTHDDQAPWWLADGEERRLAAPRSFFIPPQEHREELREGRLAKLAFVCKPRTVDGVEQAGERMWVRVDRIAVNGTYIGALQSDPAVIAGLRSGDEVAFEPRHVVAIEYLPNELGYDPAEAAAVDPAILARDTPPTRVVRFHPPGNPLPIWFLQLDGDVPPEAHLIELGRLTDFWPELAPVFAAGEGDWLRLPDEAAYVSDTIERHRALTLTALADAAGLCLEQPDDPGAAQAEAHFETVLDSVLRMHWPSNGAPGGGAPDGVAHSGIDRRGGRVRLSGKVWMIDAPERLIEVDVSAADGGTVRLGPPITKGRRGRRSRGAADPGGAWALTLVVPALDAGPAGDPDQS